MSVHPSTVSSPQSLHCCGAANGFHGAAAVGDVGLELVVVVLGATPPPRTDPLRLGSGSVGVEGSLVGVDVPEDGALGSGDDAGECRAITDATCVSSRCGTFETRTSSTDAEGATDAGITDGVVGGDGTTDEDEGGKVFGTAAGVAFAFPPTAAARGPSVASTTLALTDVALPGS